MKVGKITLSLNINIQLVRVHDEFLYEQLSWTIHINCTF